MKQIFSAENVLGLLLVFVPVAIVLELTGAAPLVIFATSGVAIIPLAGYMGRSTEHLAAHVGQGLGGILTATFGNAAELIIAIVALRAGLYDLVKASITGSIIGNILLVFGLAAFLGGLKRDRQSFNRTAAGVGSTLLLLSAIGLVLPAVFHGVVGDAAPISEQHLSLAIATVLFATYLLSLLFALKTHPHLYRGLAEDQEDGMDQGWSRGKSLGILLVSAGLIAVMSEFLVGSAEPAAEKVGMSEVFVGVIVVAVISNAAEHSTAVLMALRNKMDLAINIAVGSSTQIALFVAPALVFLSYVVGPTPMDLRFTTMEVVAVAVSVGTMGMISLDGESNWMEGAQLLAVYAILGITFFYLPH